MRTRTMRAVGMAVIPLALACGTFALAWAGQPIHEEVSATADGLVTVENLSGAVVVEGWDQNKVLVEGELGEGAEEVRVESEGDEVSIEVVLPRRAKNVEDTELMIRVPRKSSLEIETVSALVEVEGVEGTLNVETVSGSVDLRGVDVAEVESVSGAISLERAARSVEAESVSGAIELRGASGRLSASTTSGSIDVQDSKLETVACESVSGSIEFSGELRKGGTYGFENFSGSVVLNLPDGLSAEVEVETFSGDISSDFGGEVHREKYGPGASLREEYGGGDAEIAVSTFSGSVTLNRR